jgi:threonine synthase
MGSLDQSKRFSLTPAALAAIRAEFDACSTNDEETTAEIARTFHETGYVLDPHGATGVRAARRRLAEEPSTPVIALATAHPAKFPDAIAAAIGRRPQLPEHLAPILSARERFAVVDNDVAKVAGFIRERARAARAG